MITTLFVTVCLAALQPGEDAACETFDTGLRVEAAQCSRNGEQIALAWLRKHPFFEFHELTGWGCSGSTVDG